VIIFSFLLAITVIGLPWAINKYVAWSFVKQEVLFTDKSVRGAMRAAPTSCGNAGGTRCGWRASSSWSASSPARSSPSR
jgi:hypothetical protein